MKKLLAHTAVLGVAIIGAASVAAQERPAAAAPAGERAPPPRPATVYTLNDLPPRDPALKGAIDLHAHLDPDSNGPSYGQAARSLDVLDQAKRASDSGMRGFVIMGEHMDDTAQLAYIVRKLYPQLEVFGGMANNLI